MAILFAVAEHKVLATDQIELLFFGSERNAQRVLQKPRTAGLIDLFDWRTSSSTRNPNRHFLTPAGAKLAASVRHCRVAEIGALVDPDDAPKFMPHRSGVNRFFSDLVRHSLKRPGWGLETWRDEHKLRTPYGEVQPDSFGRLLHPGGAVKFDFEYDNGTEHRRSLKDKFSDYLCIASNWHSLDGKPFPCVLFVTTRDDRGLALLKALLATTKEWDPQRARSVSFPFYCSTVARLAKRGQLGAVWRELFLRHQERLRLGSAARRRRRPVSARRLPRTPLLNEELMRPSSTPKARSADSVAPAVAADDASVEARSEPDPDVSLDDDSLLPAVRAFMALARQLAAEEEA